MSQYREMRMFVIFDLPMKKKEEVRIYNQFRKNLLNDGFIMIQFSIYSRFCRNDTEYHKIVRRIKSYVPKSHGKIRVFNLTEKQFQKMLVFSDKKRSDEELLSTSPLVVIE